MCHKTREELAIHSGFDRSRYAVMNGSSSQQAQDYDVVDATVDVVTIRPS